MLRERRPFDRAVVGERAQAGLDDGARMPETGAYVQPQLPTTSVVTPWRIVLSARGSPAG